LGFPNAQPLRYINGAQTRAEAEAVVRSPAEVAVVRSPLPKAAVEAADSCSRVGPDSYSCSAYQEEADNRL
jgi:hypothetical protein